MLLRRLPRPIFQGKCSVSTSRIHKEKRLQQHGGTSILLLHNGQPRTKFYMVEHLTNFFHQNYGIPSVLGRPFVSKCFDKRIADCVRDSERYPFFGDTLAAFARDVERALSTMLPECGPVKCYPSFLYDEPRIADNLKLALREDSAVDHLIIASMYPFYNDYVTKQLLKSCVTTLQTNSAVTISSENDKWQSFIAKDRHSVSFSYLFLNEMGTFESFLKCWAHELICMFTSEVDGVIFVAPSSLNSKESNTQLADCTNHIVREMHEASDTVIAHMRLAFFKSWNELYFLSRPTVAQQLDSFRRAGVNGTILAVPIANFVDDFDTNTVLPSLLKNLEGVRLVKLDEVRNSLLNTFVELLKTRITRIKN